jgi:hypothetical protein
MSALQRKVAATIVRCNREKEAPQRGGYPWPAEAWKRASGAIVNGTRRGRRPTHYPILLTTAGPISSASELQALAETESLPEVIEVDQVGLDNQVIKKLAIFDVDENAMEKMMKKADIDPEILIVVMFEGRRRSVWTVTESKVDDTSEDEDENEEEVEGEDQEEEEEGLGKSKVVEGETGSSELAEPKSEIE